MTRRWPFRSLVIALGVLSLFFGVDGDKETGRTRTTAAGPPAAPMPRQGRVAGGAEKDLEQVRGELAAARQALAEAQQNQEDLRKELALEKSRALAAAAALADAESDLAEAKKALEKSQADKKAAETKLDAAVKAQDALRKELETTKAQLKSAMTKLDLANKDVAKAKEATKELEAAKKDLTKSQADLKAAQKKLVEAEKSKEGVVKELEAEKKKTKAAADGLVEAKKVLEKCQKALEESKTAQAVLQKKLAEETTKVKDALARLDRTTKELTLTKGVLEGKRKAAKAPAAPALIEVTLPDDATLLFDGKPTTSTGDIRVFESPALSQGWTYHYEITSEVVRDGKPVKMTAKVAVEAGKKTIVNLNTPAKEETGKEP